MGNRENAERVSIAAIILIALFIIEAAIISEQSQIGILTSISTIVKAIETFNFSGTYGPALLFLSLFIGVFAVYLFELLIGVIRDEFGGVVYMAQNLRLKKHNIVCGGGRIGEHVAFVLKERHEPVIILEKDEVKAMELKKLGFKVLRENALEESSLKMANVKKAAAIFACLGQDVDNLIVVLSARELNGHAKIITRCNSVKNINKFRSMGADDVVLPEIVGADRMVYLKEKR